MISKARASGVSIVEVLVTLVILSLGLLGIAALMAQSLRASMESYQRAQALILMQDMAVRIAANRSVAACYAFTTNTATGTPFLGTGSSSPPQCTAGSLAQQTRANRDLSDWDNLLKGVAEKTASGGSNVGAMVGARGCVSLVATNTYMVSVVWQGVGSTHAPPSSLSCGINLYGTETQRRVISITLQIPILS